MTPCQNPNRMEHCFGDDYNYDVDLEYCICGEYRSNPASAGVLRVFGQKVAELPLVVTHKEYRVRVRQACNSHAVVFDLI